METIAQQSLVARARDGDLDAFESVLEPAIPIAHRLACGLLHDPGLAEDAVQEASVRAWRKMKQLRPGTPFQPWFLGIVARQCHDQIRGRWWQIVRLPQVSDRRHEAAEERSDRAAVVRSALARLPERERRVLVLRLYLDLSWADVASAAGITEAGARTRYYRALDRLRPMLAGASEAAR
ncbi:MAG TPA: RNA polymerase sigma factor [Candidatus Dormibacteraeota bacterium]|nr:RNA polymerase sigma factor [Candidatus Dormibacteraeota bacterium]